MKLSQILSGYQGKLFTTPSSTLTDGFSLSLITTGSLNEEAGVVCVCFKACLPLVILSNCFSSLSSLFVSKGSVVGLILVSSVGQESFFESSHEALLDHQTIYCSLSVSLMYLPFGT